MTATATWRRFLAEFVGTALLVTAVVGSGVMATTLSPDDVGLQLLENSIATAFALGALILMCGPVSGAHFNPVVSSRTGTSGAATRTAPGWRAGTCPGTSSRKSAGSTSGSTCVQLNSPPPTVQLHLIGDEFPYSFKAGRKRPARAVPGPARA